MTDPKPSTNDILSKIRAKNAAAAPAEQPAAPVAPASEVSAVSEAAASEAKPAAAAPKGTSDILAAARAAAKPAGTADILAAIKSNKSQVYIAELEELEDRTLEYIQKAQHEAVSIDIKTALNYTHKSLRQCHDRMRNLKRSAA